MAEAEEDRNADYRSTRSMRQEAESSRRRKSAFGELMIELIGRTNGAAGVIPSTLKYVTEFISQDPDRE